MYNRIVYYFLISCFIFMTGYFAKVFIDSIVEYKAKQKVLNTGDFQYEDIRFLSINKEGRFGDASYRKMFDAKSIESFHLQKEGEDMFFIFASVDTKIIGEPTAMYAIEINSRCLFTPKQVGVITKKIIEAKKRD